MDLSQYTFARIEEEDVDLYVGKCVRVFNAIGRIAGLNYASYINYDERAYERDVRAAISENLHPCGTTSTSSSRCTTNGTTAVASSGSRTLWRP